jgi:hypothetical protein
MIDTSNAYQDPASLAQEISDAWIAKKLKGKQPFVLHLNRGGAPSLESVD